MKRILLALSLLALSLPGPLLAGSEFEPLRGIAIQAGGRTKPLDTFARETARRVGGAKPFGFEGIKGLEPTEWLLAMIAAPDRWRNELIVKVTHAGLRSAAGLPEDKDRYSFDELGLHRIMANHQPENERSARLLERLGFEREGYARSYLHIAGAWRDHVLTALVRPESSGL